MLPQWIRVAGIFVARLRRMPQQQLRVSKQLSRSCCCCSKDALLHCIGQKLKLHPRAAAAAARAGPEQREKHRELLWHAQMLNAALQQTFPECSRRRSKRSSRRKSKGSRGGYKSNNSRRSREQAWEEQQLARGGARAA